ALEQPSEPPKEFASCFGSSGRRDHTFGARQRGRRHGTGDLHARTCIGRSIRERLAAPTTQLLFAPRDSQSGRVHDLRVASATGKTLPEPNVRGVSSSATRITGNN